MCTSLLCLLPSICAVSCHLICIPLSSPYPPPPLFSSLSYARPYLPCPPCHRSRFRSRAQPHGQADRGRMGSLSGGHAQQAWPRGHQGRTTTPPPSSRQTYAHHDLHAHDLHAHDLHAHDLHAHGHDGRGDDAIDRREREEEHDRHARHHRAYRAQFEALENEVAESERELLSSRCVSVPTARIHPVATLQKWKEDPTLPRTAVRTYVFIPQVHTYISKRFDPTIDGPVLSYIRAYEVLLHY